MSHELKELKEGLGIFYCPECNKDPKSSIKEIFKHDFENVVYPHSNKEIDIFSCKECKEGFLKALANTQKYDIILDKHTGEIRIKPKITHKK